MGESVHVMAVLTTQGGQRDTLLKAFATIVPEVRAEAGCIRYVVTTDTPGAGDLQAPLGENVVVVVEEWESLAHLDAHGNAAHMQAFRGITAPLLASRKVHVLSEQ